MNKHLLKIFLVLSLFLCLGFEGCDDDDLDVDLTICGNFEREFGSFTGRRDYEATENGAVFYGTCETFSCAEPGIITLDCAATATGSFTEECNSTTYSLSGTAGVIADMEIDASGIVLFGEDDGTVTLDGAISADIEQLKLTVTPEGSDDESSINCSGELRYDNFDDRTFTCENADVSCVVNVVGVETTLSCDDIKTYVDNFRANTEGRAYCSADAPQGVLNDLVELAIMKIEEAIAAEEEESSEE